MNPMMRELYQETIMGHNKSPHNFGPMDDPDASADGHNPLCGDKFHVELHLDGDTVTEVKFSGEGCAISKASASMMTDAVKGLSKDDAKRMYEEFHKLITREGEADKKLLGKLKVFEGVGEFPARVKCAALSWRTLVAALEDQDSASTE